MSAVQCGGELGNTPELDCHRSRALQRKDSGVTCMYLVPADAFESLNQHWGCPKKKGSTVLTKRACSELTLRLLNETFGGIQEDKHHVATPTLKKKVRN